MSHGPMVTVRATYWHRVHAGTLRRRVRVDGMLTLADDALVLDYRETWRDPATLQRVEGPARRATVRLADLARVELRRDWRRRTLLTLHAAAFEALRALPGGRDARYVLQVRGDDAGALAASELALLAADHRLASDAPTPRLR